MAASSDQPAGPIAGTIVNNDGGRIAVAARFETDSDADGAGDETQDSCPTDAAISTGPCVVDGAVAAAATPASIEVGDIAVIDVSASNPGPGTVRGATVAAALPAGLAPVLVTPHSCSLAASFSCALGDFAAGSRDAALVVRGTAPGAYSVPVVLSTASTDPNAANNTASVLLTVVAKPAPPPPTCKVPSLRRRTRSFASALLKAAGCRLGKTKRRNVRRGRSGLVLKQSKKAGSRVPTGTRVDVTVSRRRR